MVFGWSGLAEGGFNMAVRWSTGRGRIGGEARLAMDGFSITDAHLEDGLFRIRAD